MNHLGNDNKMVSDTPRTDEQINGKPCTRYEVYLGDALRDAWVPSQFARQLERELNAAKQRIKRLYREVELLRLYGNKDCTAMADEALEKEAKP